MGTVLQWKTKERQAPFDTQEVVASNDEGVWQYQRILSTNNITQTMGSGHVPVILLDEVDITRNILGIVSCTVDLHGANWGDQAIIITTQGTVQLRGVEWFCREAPNGYALAPLPLWHFQRAADINCEVTDMIQELARGYMGELKKYCDYIYSDDSRVYEYNAGLIG